MTTKTDFRCICELKDTFKPARRGVISAAEAETVKNALELNTRTDIELCNVRDMVVMFYGQWADKSRDGNGQLAVEVLDAMSAICSFIYGMKWQRGIEG